MQAACLDLEGLNRPDVLRDVVIIDRADNDLPFDRMVCPDLRELGDLWLSFPRESGEALPRWQTFSPMKVKRLLPKICVLKARDWRADEIEFSLYGGHATEFIGGGIPLVMQTLRDDPVRMNNYYDIRDRAGRAIDNQAPQYVRKTLSWNDAGYIEYEALMLPFVAENGESRVMQPVSAWTGSALHRDQDDISFSGGLS